MRKGFQKNSDEGFLQQRGGMLVILLAALLLGLTLALLYLYSFKSIKSSIGHRAESELRETGLKIRGVMSEMELALKNNLWAIPLHADSITMTRELTKRVVRANENVMGCGVAYVPEQNGDRQSGIFAYEVHVDSASQVLVTRMAYDYTKREWYVKALESQRPYWTDPYVGMTTHRRSTSYSIPLTGADGKVAAVAFVDVALDWLGQVINDEDMNPLADNILLSHTGQILACLEDSLLNTDRFAEAVTGSAVGGKKVEALRHDMLAGKKGVATLKDSEGNKVYVHYAPVAKMPGWSMAVVNNDRDVYGDLRQMGLHLLLMMLAGLAILAFIMWRASRQAKRLQLIRSEKDRIGSELHIANEIQQSMLPKVFPPYPDRDDIDISGLLEPAKYVGGDLFDFYIRDEKLFFCIGDVSGKAVAASLVMAVTRSLFRTLSAHEAIPARIMDLMNESMAETNETTMFVTLFLGVLDLPTGRLRYCNAGHNSPLIIEKAETSLSLNTVKQLPVESNIPLGIHADYKYEGQETVVKPHSIIFLYTDGLTEAEDESRQQFGETRVMEVAQGYQQKTDVQELISEMTDKVKGFVGNAEQSDDLTLLAINYKKERRTAMLKRSITLPNDVQTIPQLSEFVEGVGEELGFDMETTMSLNLALEEAVVNVMNYAYPKDTAGTVQIDAEANDVRLKFTITDQGMPFDPTAKADADTTLSVEDRPIGGLGIFLVRQLMDSINYERVNGSNVLTLRKKLEAVNNEES